MSQTVEQAIIPAAAPASVLVRDVRAARRSGVPLIAIATPDPSATTEQLTAVFGDDPVFAWDVVTGLRGLTPDAVTAGRAAGLPDPEAMINPVEALMHAAHLPGRSVVFLHNMHFQIRDAAVIQAIWNLRDQFKCDFRTLVLLGPSFTFGPELAGDIIELDEPLPTRAGLEPVLDRLHTANSLPIPEGPARRAALDAVVGLPYFTAEQVLAMSLNGPRSAAPGLRLGDVWERKRKAIEATEGLRVWRGGERMADLCGVDNAVAYFQEMVEADAFGVVAFIDEGEKTLAGGLSDYSGDSGVAKDQIQQVLSYIEDTKSLGVLLAGLAGTGKSALAKSVAAAAGKVCVVFDLGGMKGGTVGQSERAIRQALKVLTATAEGRVLFVMTANKTVSFTPEIHRRFSDQFWFTEPDAAGRAAIWDVHGRRCALTAAQLADRPNDDGWTGAEIARVCDRAQWTKKTIRQAAQFLLPQAQSNRAELDRMCDAAAGRFLSASYPGLYRGRDRAAVPAETARRARQIES